MNAVKHTGTLGQWAVDISYQMVRQTPSFSCK